MKIKSLEFENFRNFKGSNKIEFDQDKVVTIIYGKNGDGKTTLHQMFHWIFYNNVRFNKTASNTMYNHEFEEELEYNQVFSVKGKIDFLHMNEEYSLSREWVYQKGIDESKKIKEDASLYKLEDDNWNKLSDHNAVIEELLPSGLSEYFFFDGESMIADLRVKGRESANKLKKALYTIFDLQVYEQALSHIGNNELKTTVLGQLYLSKADIHSDEKVKVIKTKIDTVRNRIGDYERTEKELLDKKDNLNGFIIEVSEKIGGARSSSDYEKERKHFKKQSNMFLEAEKHAYTRFGDEVISSFPKMLLSKRIDDAKKIIKLKADENRLIPGLSKQLIQSLIKESKCICGNEITLKEKQNLNNFLKHLPPQSYQMTYDSFTDEARKWGKGYDRELLEKHIKDVLDNRFEASNCDKMIQKLDKEAKENLDIQELIIDRQKAEEEIKEIDENLKECRDHLSKHKLLLKKLMKDFDEFTSATELNERVSYRLEIMNKVKEYFEEQLHNKSIQYSEKLQDEIQSLLNAMLTSKRKVTVSNDFFVRVVDSYDDEAKSEGQFAVVSFAYIGGILKLLKDELESITKEYPLILDGPFSKLDKDQKHNVINTIPNYAPQIILFSKDSLEGKFSDKVLGRTWTILSNEEKNVSEVREGYLW